VLVQLHYFFPSRFGTVSDCTQMHLNDQTNDFVKKQCIWQCNEITVAASTQSENANRTSVASKLGSYWCHAWWFLDWPSDLVIFHCGLFIFCKVCLWRGSLVAFLTFQPFLSFINWLRESLREDLQQLNFLIVFTSVLFIAAMFPMTLFSFLRKNIAVEIIY